MENHDDSSANRRQQQSGRSRSRTSLPQAASLQRAFQYYLAATHFASQPYPFGSRWTACPSSYQFQQQPPTPPLFSQTLGSGPGAAGVGEGSASHALPVSSQLQIIPGSSPSYYYQPQVQPTPPLFYPTLGSGSGDGAGGVGGEISPGSSSSYPYQPPQPSPMFSQTLVLGAGAGVAGSAAYDAIPAMFQANLSSSYQYQQQQPPPPPLLSQTLGSGGGAGDGGVGGSWTSHASPMLSRTIVSGSSSSTYQCQPPSSSLLDPAFGSAGGFGSVGESSASRNISRFWWEDGAHQAPTPSLLDQSYGWSGDVGSVGGNSASDPGPSSQWQGIPSGSSDYAMTLPSLDPTSSNGVIRSGNFPCSRPATFLLSLDTGLHSMMWPRAGTTAPPTSAVDQPPSSSALLPHGRQSTASVFAVTTHEGALPPSPLPPPSQTATTVQPEDTEVHAAPEQELSVDDYDLMPFVDNPVMDTTVQLHEAIGAAPEPADTSDDDDDGDDDNYAAIFYGEMNSSGDDDADINSSTTVAESSASVPSEVTVKEEPLDWSPAESSSLHIPVEHRVKEEPVDDWSPSGTDTSSPAPAATSSPLPSPAYPMVQVKIEASDWTSETSELGTNAFSSGSSSSNRMQRQPAALSETNPLLSSTGAGWGASGARSGRRGRAGRGGDSSSRSFGHDASDPLVVDFADGSFTESETKKITGEKRLAKIVLTNPKRVRSILRNRRGAQTSIDVADTGS